MSPSLPAIPTALRPWECHPLCVLGLALCILFLFLLSDRNNNPQRHLEISIWWKMHSVCQIPPVQLIWWCFSTSFHKIANPVERVCLGWGLLLSVPSQPHRAASRCTLHLAEATVVRFNLIPGSCPALLSYLIKKCFPQRLKASMTRWNWNSPFLNEKEKETEWYEEGDRGNEAG